jgi:serine/threonine protein kinase
VRLGTHLITGEKVAIKILEKDKIKDQSDVERVTREIHILKIVRHPNVIQLYEVRIQIFTLFNQSLQINRLSRLQGNYSSSWNMQAEESCLITS